MGRRLASWAAAVRREAGEQVHLGLFLVRWIVLGSAAGGMAGVTSWALLEALDWATDTRVEHGWILWLLPAAGLAIGIAYHRLGGRAGRGSALLLDEIHEPTAWVPRRMAPMVFFGTIASMLFGASVGREGTALQVSGSLSDLLARVLRLDRADRRLLLIAALAGGFGAMFGVPLAGAVFALEVQTVGRVRYEALVPSLAASIVGDLVVDGLGWRRDLLPQLAIGVDASTLGRVAVAGLVFGLASAAFAELTHLIKGLMDRHVAWPPLRLVVGGIATLALVGLVGREYLGLSLPLIDQALGGAGPLPAGWDFALKLVFTAIALGCSFPGGEVTPLFVIGATLGSALAGPVGLEHTELAAVGFVAVFAGAANTPLACTVMGVELFGSGSVTAMAVGCVVAYVFSSHRGIYPTQRIGDAKGGRSIEGLPTLGEWTHRRRRPDPSP